MTCRKPRSFDSDPMSGELIEGRPAFGRDAQCQERSGSAGGAPPLDLDGSVRQSTTPQAILAPASPVARVTESGPKTPSVVDW